MDQMIRETLDSANEKLKHTNIILKDMMENKKEYSSRDLSWRNLDLLKAMVLAVNELSMVVEEIANKTMITTVQFIEDDEEKDESYDTLNIDDDDESEDMGEYPDQEVEDENEEFDNFLDEDEDPEIDNDIEIDSDEIEEIDEFDEELEEEEGSED